MKKTFTLFLTTLTIWGVLTGQNNPEKINEFFEKKNRFILPSSENNPFECMPDSILNYEYDSLGMANLISTEYLFYYGETAISSYEYQFGSNLLIGVDSTVYDSNTRIVFREDTQYDEDEGIIVVEERIWNYYHENTNLLDSQIIHDNFPNEIEPDEKTLYQYDLEDRLVEEEIYRWNGSSQEWTPDEKRVLYYNTDGLAEYEIVSEWSWSNNSYFPSDSISNTFDANDSLIFTITYEISTQQPIEKTEVAYNVPENSFEALQFSWNEDFSTWDSVAFLSIDYNENGQINIFETFIIPWGIGVRNESVFVPGTFCLSMENVYLTADRIDWLLWQQSVYLPTSFSSTTNYSPDFQPKVYPNPTSNGIWIETLPKSFFELYTMQGQLLKKGMLNGKEYIDFDFRISSHLILKIQKDENYSSQIIQVTR